jgi:hypothetical protein
MTSAAYGVCRDSTAGVLAERCPVSAFFATVSFAGGMPDEESRTRHAPIRGFGRSRDVVVALAVWELSWSRITVPVPAN